MKGLLLKDLYMTAKYCRAYLLIVVVFVAVSFAGGDNLFFLFYPCLLAGMIPVNLLAYDERSKWSEYVGTLPYTKAQIVSGKYIIGLIAFGLVMLVSSVTQAISMSMNGTFSANDLLVLVSMFLILFTVSSSICLPFVFRYGVEKGRIAYFVMIGVICGGSVIAASLFRAERQADVSMNGILPVLCLVSVGIYAFSWYMSIVFYKKREG